MVIVDHKWACGETYKYVMPGASIAGFEARHNQHMQECKKCKANVKLMNGEGPKIHAFASFEPKGV